MINGVRFMSVFRSVGRTDGWMDGPSRVEGSSCCVCVCVCGVRKKGYDIVVAKDMKFN